MPWVKGQSGNPKGAPRRANSLARQIREETRQGAELVEFSLAVLRDEKAPLERRQAEKAWLADRGWGKAVEHIELTDETQSVPAAIGVEQLESIAGGPVGTVQ